MTHYGVFYEFEKDMAIHEIVSHYYRLGDSYTMYRVKNALAIMKFLIPIYNHSCVYIYYIKNFCINIDDYQFKMFKREDYLNPDLFLKRLQYTLLNRHNTFEDKIDTTSNEFNRDGGGFAIVNKIADYTGYGILIGDDDSFIVGNFENGWGVGEMKHFDKFFTLLNEHQNYDNFFENFLYTLVD